MNTRLYLDLLRTAFRAARFVTVPLVLSLGVLPIFVFATSVVPPDFPQLVNESDYIVHAVVKSVTSEWREKQGHRHIFTLVELDVREVISGSPPQPLILEILGGRVGDEEMVVSGVPRFQVGDEDILFIQGNGQNICPLFAIMHGRYPILKEKDTGREYVARSNTVPLQDTAEVGLPMSEGSAAALQLRLKNISQALTPADFARRIKITVNPAYRKIRQR